MNPKRLLNHDYLSPANHFKWFDNYYRLKEWVAENGHTWPGQNSEDKETAFLGRWCANQRQAIRDKQALPMRKYFLDKIDFKVDYYTYTDVKTLAVRKGNCIKGQATKGIMTHKERVKAVHDYKKEFGEWPKQRVNPKSEEDRELGRIVNDLRVRYSKGLLTKAEIRDLEKKDFVFCVDEHNFEAKVKRFKAFKKEYGCFNPPSLKSLPEEDKKTYHSINSARFKPPTDPEQFRKLRALGVLTGQYKNQGTIEPNLDPLKATPKPATPSKDRPTGASLFKKRINVVGAEY